MNVENKKRVIFSNNTLPHIILVGLAIQHFGRVSPDENDSKGGEQEQYNISQQEQSDGQIKKYADG